MVRGQMNFKRLTLTDIKIDINRVPKKKTLVAALEAAGKLSFCLLCFFVVLACEMILSINYLQMLRTSGRAVLGEENLLSRRREPHLMILTGLRSCWQR